MGTERWARRWTVVALAVPLATFAAAGGARAQAPETAASEAKITLDLRDVPFRTAIEALFEKTGLQYAIEPQVPNIPVRVNVRDIDFTTALRTISRLGGATYRKEGQIYIVGLRQPPSLQPELTTEFAPETAPGDQIADQTWEKIPILFNSYAIMAYAFGGQVLPTEDQLFSGGGGGGGGFGGGGQGGFGGGGLGGGGFGGGGQGGFGGGGFGGGGQGGFGGGGFGGGGGLGGGGAFSGPLARTRGRF